MTGIHSKTIARALFLVALVLIILTVVPAAGADTAHRDPGVSIDSFAATATSDEAESTAPHNATSDVGPAQPNVTWGGRTLAVDVHPENDSIALAASESGGLFKTVDGGANWTHLGGATLPHRLSDVKFAPSNPDVIILTAHADARRLEMGGRTISGGGIWRSTDGGETWNKTPSSEPPDTFACSGEAITQGIAFEPNTTNVYVGTECSLAISNDLGSTWTHVRVGPDDQEFAVSTVLSPAEGIVDVGTVKNGHYRLDTASMSWQANNLPASFMWNSPASLAASPDDPDVLFAVVQERDRSCGTRYNISRTLYESSDGGNSWNVVEYPDRCDFNRPPFVVTPPVATNGSFDVFVGNGDDTFRQENCSGSGCTNATSAWTKVSVDHADQIDIAYPSGSACPLFMANDGGVEKTRDCGATWHNVGNSTNAGGFNALQLYRVHGQIWPDHTDLYVGTQDNSIWASPDGGATWPNAHSNEGGWMSMARYGSNHENETVTGEAEAGQFKATPHLNSTAAWPNPPNISAGSSKGSKPYFIEEDVYLQWSNETDSRRTLWLTNDTGSTWSEVVTLREPHIRGNPIVGPPDNLTMYVPHDAIGFDAVGLKKITNIRGPGPANVTNVDDDLGSLAIHVRGQGTFDWHTVVAADPNDPDHLIVVDADAKALKVSHDGGQTWKIDRELTKAVTESGSFDMLYGTERGTTEERRARNSLVTAIAFDPDPANDRILVGTEDNGIIASKDGGETWGRMPGSREVPAITAFFFDDRTGEDSVRDVYVSTYGRGLWRVDSIDRLISQEPVPVDSCGRLDTFFRYELAENVTDTRETGACLRIPVDDLSLDGQGYAVRNPAGDVYSEGINVTGASDVRLRNLTVEGWDDGIAINGAERVRITDGVLRENEDASVFARSSTDVDAVDLYFNSTDDYEGELIYRGVSRGLITDNRFEGSNNAVHAMRSESLRIEANEFTATNTGIRFVATNDTRIADNRLIDNDGDGIILLGDRGVPTGSSGNVIVNNTVRDNDESGIVIRDSKDALVRNNTVTDNTGPGITLGGGIHRDIDVADIRIADNHVAGNNEGITLTGYDAARYEENPTGVRNVRLVDNTVLNNDEEGITLFSAARVTMRNNSIAGSYQDFVVGEYDLYEDAFDRIRTKANYYHDIDQSNTIDGKPIYYLRNASDRTIGPPEDPGFVGVVDGSNVTVRNLSFSNVSHGVLLVDTPGSRVENVSTRTVTYGVFLSQGSNRSAVVENDVEADTTFNFDFSSRGVSVISTNDVLVANNTITRRGAVSSGIELAAGASHNRVANNTVRDHFRGIVIGALGTASANPGVDNNTIVDNRLVGIEMGIDDATRDTTGNTIARNVIDSAYDVGISLQPAEDYSVVDNVIRESGQGISTRGNATLRNNLVRDIDDTGISALDGTTVLNNTVLDTGEYGIDANGDGIIVRNNTVMDGRTGIRVDGAGSLVEHNVVGNVSGLPGRGAGIRYQGYDTNTIRDNTVDGADFGILVAGGKRGSFEGNSVRNATTGIQVSDGAVNNSFVGDTVLNAGTWAFEERADGFVDTVNTTATNLTVDSTVWRVDSPIEVSFETDDAALDVAPRTVCDPAGYANLGVFLHATNTTPGGWLDLTIDYPEGAVDRDTESTISLWRYDAAWSEVPGATVDTSAGTVSANVTEFDYEVFALLAEGTATCPTLAPNVSVSETGDVGPVFPGETANATVVVENVGFAPLQVNETMIVSDDAGVFGLSNGGSFTLDPDEARDLTIAFAPSVTGTYEASLNVTSNDTAAESVTVDLTGASNVLTNATAIDRSDGNRVVGYADTVEISVDVIGGSTDVAGLVANATRFGWGNVTLTDGNDDGTYNGTFTVYASGTDADGRYSIPVVGVDAGDNTNRTATNALTLDTTPPTITNATATDATDGDGSLAIGDTVTVSANVSDTGAGVETVTANASVFGVGNVTLSDDDGDGIYDTSFTVGAGTDGTFATTVVGADPESNTVSARTNPLRLNCVDRIPIDTPTNITTSGCYVLTSDITVSDRAAGIRIKADGVTILGMGHAITNRSAPEDSTAIAAGLNGSVHRDLTVRNVSLADFRRGIDFDNALDVRVEDIVATGVAYPLSFDENADVDSSLVVRNVRGTGPASARFDTGIGVYGYNATVENVRLSEYNTGIAFSGNGTVRNVTLSNNSIGIDVRGTVLSVADSEITGSTDAGVEIYHASDGDAETTITSTLVSGNDVGITVIVREGASQLRIRGNQITGNGVGIALDPVFATLFVAGIDVHGNLIANNSRYGLRNDNTTAGTYVNATGNDWELADGAQKPATNATGADVVPVADPVTGTLANGTGDNVSEGGSNGTANVRFDPVREVGPVGNDTTCIAHAVSGSDDTISLTEIQTAINWWAEDTEVPDTGGETISLTEVQSLINAWAEGTTVSCGG